MMHDPVSLAFTAPFTFDPARIRFDDAVSFIVGALLAVTVHAEAQAFAATFLGDARTDDPGRFHFNAFRHLDIAGVLCFLAAGFGWPGPVDVCRERFSRPRLYSLLTSLAGPFANLLLASIAGSAIWLLKHFGSDDRVFGMVMSVNLTVAVYHLLPVPPLAGAALISSLFPKLEKMGSSRSVRWAGSALLICYFGWERISGHHFLGNILYALADKISRIIVG